MFAFLCTWFFIITFHFLFCTCVRMLAIAFDESWRECERAGENENGLLCCPYDKKKRAWCGFRISCVCVCERRRQRMCVWVWCGIWYAVIWIWACIYFICKKSNNNNTQDKQQHAVRIDKEKKHWTRNEKEKKQNIPKHHQRKVRIIREILV